MFSLFDYISRQLEIVFCDEFINRYFLINDDEI